MSLNRMNRDEREEEICVPPVQVSNIINVASTVYCLWWRAEPSVLMCI
jgi:hypothetical protein